MDVKKNFSHLNLGQEVCLLKTIKIGRQQHSLKDSFIFNLMFTVITGILQWLINRHSFVSKHTLIIENVNNIKDIKLILLQSTNQPHLSAGAALIANNNNHFGVRKGKSQPLISFLKRATTTGFKSQEGTDFY